MDNWKMIYTNKILRNNGVCKKMDVGTGLAVLGSATLVTKLLGPTTDYIGEEFKNWNKRRIENIKCIFSNAEKKLGDRIEHEGRVSPRVVKGILFEASFCDDPLFHEYFGGILASPRSGRSRDDRGAYFIEVVNRLSNYQLRAHYIFYHIAKNLFDGSVHDPSFSDGRAKMGVFIPGNVFIKAMDFDEKEEEMKSTICDHIMTGLGAQKLIGPEWVFDNNKEVLEQWINERQGRIKMSYELPSEMNGFFEPSLLGIELFLWAYGRSDLSINKFLDKVNHFEILNEINIPSGFQSIFDIPPLITRPQAETSK
jgi:hypothetical protein